MTVLILLHESADRKAFMQRAKKNGLKLKPFDGLPTIFELKDRSEANFDPSPYPEIKSIEDDRVSTRPMLVQNYTLSDEQRPWWGANWGLARHTRRENPFGAAGLRLPFESDFSCARTGLGVDIYVVDTGVVIGHSEFGGRAASIYEAISSGGAGDDNGHGTGVASCAAGATTGFAPEALVWSSKGLASDNTGTTSGLIAAMDACVTHYNGRAATNRPAVMNCSFSGTSTLYNAAVASATAAGLVVVAAAANDGLNLDSGIDAYPAESPHAITVGATVPNDGPTSFTNYGSQVDVCAAGNYVYAAHFGGAFSSKAGTSFSSPLVAGMLACILQDYQRLTSRDQVHALKSFFRQQATFDVNFNTRPDLGTRFVCGLAYLDPAESGYAVVPGLVAKV